MSKLKESFNETKTNLKMSWHFIKNKKSNLILMIILTIILSLISVIVPILSAQLLLKLTNGLLNELLKIAIFMFIIEISRNIVSFFLRKITQTYMVKTVTEIQIEMFKETLKIETSEIDKNSSGTFIDRIKNDTTDIINIFSSLISCFVDMISNIGILLASLVISPYMFIYFLITTIIIGFINAKERDIYYKESKKHRITRERSTGLAAEFIRGIKDVKLLNGSEGILKQTKKEMDKVNKERIEIENRRFKFSLLSGSIRDFFDITFIALGIYLVSKNLITPANLLILYMYRTRIESLLNFYDRLIDMIKSYNLSATRVFEVLGDYFKKENTEGITLDKTEGNIEFKNVNFAYTEDEVLKNINFKINKGERVGFVGTSGSGKSTIFNLITKLYRLESGSILIDDIDINKISNESLRKNISLIPQNPYIFNFTILENLKISNTKATMEEIINSCKKANIYDRIMEFEKTFETEVGEGGVILSGGEKQRIAIARSLLKQSNILLFDEATSSLDNITQKQVQDAIYGLDKEKTILIIAHRLSTVVNCDKIIVIDDGKIIDIGTHLELLNNCKKYKELFKYEQTNRKKEV